MKLAIILRGLPGSGKSTIAAMLAPAGQIFSTDRFFLDEQGVYRFDPARLGTNHAKNKDAWVGAIRQGLSPIVCDNTNMRLREMEDYSWEASQAGYQVAVLLVGSPTDPTYQQVCAERNQHGVPLATIQRMGSRFEP